jgi:hypothetical protein
VNHQKRSKIQEKRGASQYGGQVTPGSGNGWIRKADVRTDNELIEFKTTTKASYSLTAADLRKLWEQALIDNKVPLFEIEFANHGITCVIMDKNDYIARERGRV